ncbi:MAG TPA: DUF1585 domain-containing protein, partial [Myxococcota bacterium]
AQKIHDDPNLPYCMAQKTMTYALGKGVTDYDFVCNVYDVTNQFNAGGNKMSDLVLAIVKSPSFRMRRAEGGQP